MPNLNYPGSSGFGILPGGRYGRLTGAPTPSTSSPDYGVYDATTGRVVSINTGQPWNGVEPRSGVSYQAGMPSAASAASANTVNAPGIGPINPNDPSQRYRPVDILKAPDIASAQNALLETFRKTAADSLKSFPDYLKEFQTDLGTARTAASRALDTSGTEASLRAATDQYGNALDSSNAAYQRQLAENAANQRAVVTQAQNDLPLYDRALSDVEAQQLAAMTRQFSKYKLGSGTPTTPSSYENALLAREAGAIAAPIHLAQVNRRYDILSGMAMPTEQSIGAQGLNYAGSFLPGIAGSRYASETATANAIQELRSRVAGMSVDNAIRFMQAQGVPVQMMQQILSGQIGQLGSLAQIEDQSRYRGLQDVLGAVPSQPVAYNMAQPPLPGYPTRYPQSSQIPVANPVVQAASPAAPGTVPAFNGAPPGTTYRRDATGNVVAVAPGSTLPGYWNSPNPAAGIGGTGLITGSDGVQTWGGRWSRYQPVVPQEGTADIPAIGG